jgi:hypothetical protein
MGTKIVGEFSVLEVPARLRKPSIYWTTCFQAPHSKKQRPVEQPHSPRQALGPRSGSALQRRRTHSSIAAVVDIWKHPPGGSFLGRVLNLVYQDCGVADFSGAGTGMAVPWESEGCCACTAICVPANAINVPIRIRALRIAFSPAFLQMRVPIVFSGQRTCRVRRLKSGGRAATRQNAAKPAIAQCTHRSSGSRASLH